MAPSMSQQFSGARQPLLAAEEREDAPPEWVTSGLGAAAAGGSAGGIANTPDSIGGDSGGQLPPLPTCRICLEDGSPSSCVQPCSCSGSIQWSHPECIQRWIDEKHDKTCEICRQPFRGAFADPPPWPSPASQQRAADEATFRRIMLLSDPNMVMLNGGGNSSGVVRLGGGGGSGGGDPGGSSGDGSGAGVGSSGRRGDSGEEWQAWVQSADWSHRRSWSRAALFGVVACLCFCTMAAFVWATNPAEAGGGDGSGLSTLGVRILLVSAWVLLHTIHAVMYSRERGAAGGLGFRRLTAVPPHLDAQQYHWQP